MNGGFGHLSPRFRSSPPPFRSSPLSSAHPREGGDPAVQAPGAIPDQRRFVACIVLGLGFWRDERGGGTARCSQPKNAGDKTPPRSGDPATLLRITAASRISF